MDIKKELDQIKPKAFLLVELIGEQRNFSVNLMHHENGGSGFLGHGMSSDLVYAVERAINCAHQNGHRKTKGFIPFNKRLEAAEQEIAKLKKQRTYLLKRAQQESNEKAYWIGRAMSMDPTVTN